MRSTSAAGQVVQEKAAQMRALAREQGAEARERLRDAHLDERAAELRDRVRSSTAAQQAAELAARARESAAAQQAAELAARARETAAAQAAELAARARETAAAQHVAETARQATDRGLERLGGWLSEGPVAERLHLQPAKRRLSPWLAAAVGVALGYAVAVLTGTKRGEEWREHLGEDADAAASRAGSARSGSGDGEPAPPGDVESLSPPRDLWGQEVSRKPLEDKVRTALGEDPRTAALPRLNINIVEGTVFVRGVVPAGFDNEALRDVVSSVDGVTDVDLQVSSSGE